MTGQTQDYSGASKAAWILLFLTCGISVIPFLGFGAWIIAVPVLLTTFILSIIVLSRGGTLEGLLLLGMTIVGAPLFIALAPFVSSLGAAALPQPQHDSSSVTQAASSQPPATLPVATATTSPAQSAPARHSPPPAYTIVKRWSVPAGGEGKLIVISPQLATESGLTRLAEQLRQDTDNDRFAFISVFTDSRAAKMRGRVASDSLSKSDQKFYDRHFVAQYWKNEGQGVNEFEMHPAGIGTPSKKITF